MSGAQPSDRDRHQVSALLAPVVSDAGLDLEDVEIRPAGRRLLLRVVVDRDGGVGLDDLARLDGALAETLESADALGGRSYVLEVTSPGVDRPLAHPRHWRRATDRLVTVGLSAGGEVSGRVVAADEHGVTLDVAGGRQRYGYDEIGQGRVQVEFRRRGEGAS